MEQKKIVRTFKFYTITIKDGKTLEVIRTEQTSNQPNKEKVAVKFLKETGNTNFIIDIQETEEVREISFDDFIKNSKVVTPKSNNESVVK